MGEGVHKMYVAQRKEVKNLIFVYIIYGLAHDRKQKGHHVLRDREEEGQIECNRALPKWDICQTSVSQDRLVLTCI